MNSLMFDYILNVLAPKEYRLELKNRLENLCSLTGQTMSPGLTKWLEKTFGIEMVRVIQDYANLGGNKFPPDYLENLKRIVPGNYKGSDVNQGFRQLFDVNCCDNFYIASFRDNTWASFSGWTLNGYADYDWGSLAASFGGSYILDFSGIAPPFSPPSQATFIYQGDVPPPDLVGTDAFNNPVSYTWDKICQKSVWQMEYPFVNTPTISNIQIDPVDIDLLYYGGPSTLSAFDTETTQNIITAALQAYYGPDAYCVISYSAQNTGYIIDFFNVYSYTVNMNNQCINQVEYNASEFDLTNISFGFSNIYADTIATEWKYGSQLVSCNCPAGFILGFKTDFLVAPSFYATNSSTELIANGTVSTLDPSGYFSMPSIFTGNHLTCINGQYLTITSIGDPSPYSDNIKILNPYDNNNTIQIVSSDCIV
jgi:hypothetical protein